ncbi:hypothetical protein LPJ61_005817 [Coemansia biformis]|uniref:Mitochondrial carrier n=1 Tax=Coemansia biformis TaxID=1286918 RepID=A0A9W7Y2M7_9FUNG|nr:hypothetical protein LPJ61_005817 [Coemansia biformis]
MADFSNSNASGGNGPNTAAASNPYRPYAEPVGGRSGSGGGLYDDLQSPLEGLRNANSTGPLGGNPLRVSGLPIDADALEDMEGGFLEYEDQLDTAQAATELAKFAGYRYLATLAANPFSICQTLLQVQYLPVAARCSEPSDARRERDGEGDDAPDPDDPAYYEYLRARHAQLSEPYRPVGRARVDHRGYIVGDHERDGGEVGKPGYQLDALPAAKLTVLRRLVAHPTEGVLSMFKGAFTQWTYDMLHLLLQPTLEGLLNEMLGLYDSAPMATYIDSTAPSALTLVASSVIVGWLLSPLELVRTRLMVQSASPIHRKYRGMVHALRTVTREEGGLSSLYFSPFHLVPTLVKHTLDPVFRSMGSFAIDRVAGIDPYDHPAAFSVGRLVWKTISVVVMLPIDTIRARLQAQPRYATKGGASSARLKSKDPADDKQPELFREFRSCVPLSPIPYTGMANCAWRIITEEGESLNAMQKRLSAAGSGKNQYISNVGHYGLRGLYPGIALQLVANVAIFGLDLVGTADTEITF